MECGVSWRSLGLALFDRHDRVPAKINYLRYFNAASTKQWQTIKIRMENPKDTQTNTIVEIAPDGDLILIVGPEEAKLHVHSMLLRAVSKPFSTMFGPDWKEGHDLLDCDRPAELLLPEDNAAALKIICSIIHHQNREVPQTLAAGDVLAVAVTADKYDCVQALRFASESWLRPSRDKAGNLMLLTAAAYLFQNAQAFKEITKALILDYDGPYLTLSCREIESAMSWKVFCKYPDDRFGNMTDEQMNRSAGRAERVCKAGAGRNSHNRSKRWDWAVCSQVWMDKQICICIYKALGKEGSLASTLIQYLHLQGPTVSGENA